MQIVCATCSSPLNLPDDKIPNRAFGLNCPICRARLRVDPTATPPSIVTLSEYDGDATISLPTSSARAADGGGAAAASGGAAPVNGGAALTNGGASNGGDLNDTRPTPTPEDAEPPKVVTAPGDFEALPNLRPSDAQRLNAVPPVAFLVNLTDDDLTSWVAVGLEKLGMETIQRFDDVEAAVDVLEDTGSEIGILLIRVDKASAPPFEPLKPLDRLPSDRRRKLFVVLMADNVRSLDGQVAFFLKVNCLIQSGDLARMPKLVRQALLFHLNLYKHWHSDVA